MMQAVTIEKNPPLVKRGLYSQNRKEPGSPAVKNRLGLHWIRGTFPERRLCDMVDFLSVFFGKEYERQRFGRFKYTRCYLWPLRKITVNFIDDMELSEQLVKKQACIDVPGSACDDLTPHDMELLLSGLKAFDFKPTRLDVYFDDNNRTIEPCDLVQQGIIERDNFCGFNSGENKQRYKKKRIVHDEVNFGRKGNMGCGKYLRVYDKALESKFDNMAIRWEVELSGDKAVQAYWGLVRAEGNLELFSTYLGALVGGCISFVKKTGRAGDKNIKRLEVYEWWKAIVDEIGKCKFVTVRKRPTIDAAKNWVEKSVAPSISAIRKAMTDDEQFFEWFMELCDKGNILNERHKSMIREYRAYLSAGAKSDIAGVNEFFKAPEVFTYGEWEQ